MSVICYVYFSVLKMRDKTMKALHTEKEERISHMKKVLDPWDRQKFVTVGYKAAEWSEPVNFANLYS